MKYLINSDMLLVLRVIMYQKERS